MSSIDLLVSTLTADLTYLCVPSATASKWVQTIISRYSEPQRHYHTTTHVASMLDSLSKYESCIQDQFAVKLAIYFHDIVYDPTRTDNEIQSIKLFDEFVSLWVS